MIESGENFGKYTLLERLAIGGMAEIFKARAGGLDGFEKIVAIKRLHRQYSEDHDFATMLIDEAKLAVQLTHANIGQVFDLGCIDGQYFIVMEFIDGLDLHELAARIRGLEQALSTEAVVYIASAVAEALHYAHHKVGSDGRLLEIVHRDVSPQNIMLSVDGEVKLVDFGIAKARMRAQHTKAGIIKGKFYYMSPEQALGHRIDARTDVYALGMVLYEIFCGRHPFDQVPDGELLKSVRVANYAPISHHRPDLPRALTDIIDRALARNPEQRYGSAFDLKRALEGFARDELPPFERIDLGELVRGYVGPATQAEGRGAEEMMERSQYSASQHSVIFDVAATEVDFADEQTRVFIRDHGEDEPVVEDLGSGEETSLLIWADPAGQSASNSRAAHNVGAGEEHFVEGEGVATAPSPSESVAGEAPAMGGRYGADNVGDHGPRDMRGVATRFDHLLRRRPHVVGGALAGAALILLAAAALIALGPEDRSEDEQQQRWHASIADEDQAGGEVGAISLAVSTTPANAALYRDGVFAGNTPATLSGLEVGDAYVLRFEKDDFDARELTIVIEPDMAPLVVRLEPLGGIIEVQSRPEGAQVYLDGESQGPAPVTIMGLERDLIYEVSAHDRDGQVEEATVQWRPGASRVQQLRFDFEADERNEQVQSKEVPPQPAVVAKRAKRTKKAAVRRAPTRRAAPRKATVGAAGGGATKSSSTLNVWELANDAETGRLNVRIGADSGRIYVDDKLVHDGASLMGHSLDVGTYRIKVYFSTLKRYSETQTVAIRAGETSTVRFDP